MLHASPHETFNCDMRRLHHPQFTLAGQESNELAE